MANKGQSATSMAVLVLIIALLIVFYVVLVPPAEREKLLGPELTGEELVLLSELPGLIGGDERIVREELAPINLYIKTEPELIDLAHKFTIKKNLLSERVQDVFFDLEDFKDLKSIKLMFFAEGSGELILELNDKIIYVDESSGGVVVDLPRTYLSESNKIRFKLDFSILTSRYTIKDISLKIEKRLVNEKEERTFFISSQDYGLIRTSRLAFVSYCNTEDGNLKLMLNGAMVFSGSLPCYTREIEFDVSLKSGENRISFEIDKGDFNFDDISIINELKERNPRYRFDINKDNFNELKERGEVMLAIDFLGEGRKRGTIVINGNGLTFDTEEMSFEADVLGLLKEGSNSLEIVPKNVFEIGLLEIRG